MVSTTAIIFMVISTLVCFLLPVALLIWVKRRGVKGVIGAALLGTLGFMVMQIAIRVPVIQIFSTQQWYIDFAESNIWLYGLILGMTAGLFEETGRFLVFRFLLKSKRQWEIGFAEGVGHGGIEAMLLVGMSYINNLVFSFMINAGQTDVLMAAVGGDQTLYNYLITSLVETPAYMFLIGGLERAFTIFIHIALSMLILEGIRKKQVFKYFAIAVGFHTLLDGSVIWIPAAGGNIWMIEGLVMLFAVASVWYLYNSYKRFKAEDNLLQAGAINCHESDNQENYVHSNSQADNNGDSVNNNE
jgi:uncharacterized membrane protein YhfC